MEPDTDDRIEGQRIVAVRRMTDDELKREDWHLRHGDAPAVLELESGTRLYPSTDPEGNAPGAIFGIDTDDTPFALFP